MLAEWIHSLSCAQEQNTSLLDVDSVWEHLSCPRRALSAIGPARRSKALPFNLTSKNHTDVKLCLELKHGKQSATSPIFSLPVKMRKMAHGKLFIFHLSGTRGKI